MRNLIRPGRRIRELAQPLPGLYRGRLAEEYDGIGQYVLVALAGSSVSGAYRSRVAAGDFGGGRTFPKGTPVVIASHRGLLEVLSLGNQPRECIPEDLFERTVSDSFAGGLGWTQYSTGGLASQRSVGVDGTRAYVTALTNSTVTYLGGLDIIAAQFPIEFYSELELAPLTATGVVRQEIEVNYPSLFFSENVVESRYSSGVLSLRMRLTITDTATFTDQSAIKSDYPTAWINEPLAWRLRIESGVMKGKLWPVSGTEPDEWEVENTGSHTSLLSNLTTNAWELATGIQTSLQKTGYIDTFRVTEGIRCADILPYGSA